MSEQKKLFDIREWVPYQLWRLSQEAGYILEDYYGKKYNIRGESWRFMAMLASSAPISAKKLGQSLDMDQVQVTRALNKLIDNGYVSRRTDPQDRRRVILNLSKQGTEVYQDIAVKAKDLETRMLEKMPKGEQEDFKQALKGLLATLDGMG